MPLSHGAPDTSPACFGTGHGIGDILVPTGTYAGGHETDDVVPRNESGQLGRSFRETQTCGPVGSDRVDVRAELGPDALHLSAEDGCSVGPDPGELLERLLDALDVARARLAESA